jgi:hypothetical protein
MEPISYFQAVVLGLLQGFSELFPISSLGHSVVIPQLFGWNVHQNDDYFVTFLVATHAATALVLLGFFWADWVRIVRGLCLMLFGAERLRRRAPENRQEGLRSDVVIAQRLDVRKALSIAGRGEQSRRFVYVEDLAEGVIAALHPVAANLVYNLVADEDTTVLEIAQVVRDQIGDIDIIHTEGRVGDFRGIQADGSRAANELGCGHAPASLRGSHAT